MAVVEPQAEGRDLLVSAQTGSGKTVAFGLAIADTLLEGAATFGPAREPLALIIAPTRELALQVQRELSWLYHYAGARIVACVGGMDPGRERRELSAGAHIVVGTPGRLRDHLERRALNVSALKAVVLDEADEMLDMGFREDLEFILETTPAERRTLLFSATLPKAIVTLASQLSEGRPAHRHARRDVGPCRHRISRRAHRRQQDRTRRGQPVALPRSAGRAGLLRHARAGAPHGGATARNAALPPWPCRANCPRASATMRCRPCATDARGSAWRPTWRRAASTCRTWRW